MHALATLMVTIGVLLLLALVLGLLGIVALELRWIVRIWSGDTEDRRL